MPDLRPLAGLENRLSAEVLRPGDPGYAAAGAVWNSRRQGRPAAIVRCRTAGEVAESIRALRHSGLALAIRGSGHHVGGFAAPDGAVTIDVSSMNAVGVDPGKRTVVVGPGVRARELNAATQPFGLATTTAPVTTCGMAGYTLGGGLGWIARRHGLACDNLIAAEVVTAAGQIVRASADEHPDLFWALRGGGGNFGVVTEFTLQLHPVGPEVVSGQIVYRWEDAPAALRACRDFMETAPDELTCMPVVFQLPPIPTLPPSLHGQTVLGLVPFYAGDLATGLELLRPLAAAAEPLFDTVGPSRYETLLSELDEMYRPGDRNSYASLFLDDFSDPAIDGFLAAAAPVPSPFSSIFIEWLGGAVGRVSPDHTAYPHRERKVCLTAVPKWEDIGRDADMTGWARRVHAALQPFAAPGVYGNYADRPDSTGDAAATAPGEEELARAVYGAHYDRLAEIKHRWDPDNLFRANHNVPPTAGPAR